MENSQLHVSFDDGFSSTQELDRKPDATDRKKSILASANNRINENKTLLLDDSLNTGDIKDKLTSKQDSPTQSKLPVSLGTAPTAQRTTSTTSPPQNETKSKIPVSLPNDNLNLNGKTSPSDNNPPKMTTEVPIEIALKGFIGQPKQTYNAKIPRFNLNYDSQDTKSYNKEDQNSKEGPSVLVNDQKKPYSPPREVIIDKNQLKAKGDELIPLEDLQESPFNRRRHSPKHSKSKDKGTKSNTSTNDAPKDGTDATTVTGTDIIEPPKGSGTPAPIYVASGNQITEQTQPATSGIEASMKNDQAKAKEAVKSKLLLKSTYETKELKMDTVEGAKTAKSNTHAIKSDKNSSETGKLVTETKETDKTKETTNKDKSKREEPNKKHIILETKKDQSGTDSLKLKKTNDFKNDKNKSDKTKTESNTVIVSTRSANPNPPTKDSKGKSMEKKSSKEKLSVPPVPNHNQSTDKDKSLGQPPSAPATPRKERLNRDKIKTIVKSSRDASPARSPKRSQAGQDHKKIKPSSDSKPEKLHVDNETDPVTTRDIKVESTVDKTITKTDDKEAKETADTILNELGDKPKSILARVAMKKIAARAAKSGPAQQNGDVKHVSVSDSLNQSKSSGKFALSVPAKGKKDSEDKDDKTSLGSRRDSSKYSIDTASRKSIDIRIQNQVLLNNKPIEEKPKSLLTNTDSWIRSAIPHLPMGVAVLCLMLNIMIPGSGTMLSGVAILCCGRPRVNSKDGHVISTICVNVWVGFAQLFTITFLFVGWFWSLAWGIRMIILAAEYRREQQLQREKQLQTMALSAFGSASNMRSLFP